MVHPPDFIKSGNNYFNPDNPDRSFPARTIPLVNELNASHKSAVRAHRTFTAYYMHTRHDPS